MALDPFFAAMLDQLPAEAAGPPPSPEEMREGDRKAAEMFAPKPPTAVGSVVDAALAGVPVRVYRPDAAGPVPTVVFSHGGGWMIGDLDTHDAFCRRMCRDVGVVVVAVAYRLVPEHPYPAGYEDCLAVAHYVADHLADFGGGSLALAGDSAGGNLAAGVALTLRDEGRPLAAQLLVYPALDLGEDQSGYPSMTDNATGYGLTGAEIQRLRTAYLAEHPDSGEYAPVSPIRARSLEGLPPTVIGAAEYDPLRDQALSYAEALLSASVPVSRHMYEGLPHAFITFTTVSEAAESAVRELFADFKRVLSSA